MDLVEKSLLTGEWSIQADSQTSDVLSYARKVVEGSFTSALTSPLVEALFTTKNNLTDLATQPLDVAFPFDASLEGSDEDMQLVKLCTGVACLHAFVQLNWTGPDLDLSPAEIIHRHQTSSNPTAERVSEDHLDQRAISELAYRGEPAYHLAKFPAFLRWAQIIFALDYPSCPSIAWWRLRTTRVHLQLLDEPVAVPPELLVSADGLAASSRYAAEPDLAGALVLETGLLEHQLAHDRAAAGRITRAAQRTGLEYELTGALGKRTKFQQDDLSQLIVLAESRGRNNDKKGPGVDRIETTRWEHASSADLKKIGMQERIVDKGTVPEGLLLNDDTLLEQTQYTSSSASTEGSRLRHLKPGSQPALHPLDQCILLGLCLNVKNTSPIHGLTTEQMTPYVARVISHPENWSVHTMALMLRSRLEAHRTRTVERSTLQLQALIDQMPTSDSTLSERLQYFHAMVLPSKWEMEKELALRFLSLGVVRSALEIFERLELWEEVVKCWQSMERKDQALKIVHGLLEGRLEEADLVQSRAKSISMSQRHALDSAREAKLWCLLGDLEPEHALEHYEKAWEVSKGTSGRAIRSLGGYHFARGHYDESIGCLRKAVSINPLLHRTWFVLGCSYVQQEAWEKAKEAFSRCVSIDDEDGESWNNLATVYLRTGSSAKPGGGTDKEAEEGTPTTNSSTTPFSNKVLAFRALKQGLKYSYQNWRMWSNYMVVAMDVGEYFEACRALSRIVEERSQKDGAACVDLDVLDRLVDVATRASNEAVPVSASAGSPAAIVSSSSDALLRRIVGLTEQTILTRVSSPRIFKAYARLLTWQARWEETIKAYLDAYRSSPAGTMDRSCTDIAQFREALREVEEMVDLLKNFGPRAEGFNWRLQARSIVRTFAGRTRENFEDDPIWERMAALQEDLRQEE